MAHKGQPRFQDDRWRFVTGWCPSCWFRWEEKFHASLDETIIRSYFKKYHATLPNGEPNPCTLAPKIPYYDGPRTQKDNPV